MKGHTHASPSLFVRISLALCACAAKHKVLCAAGLCVVAIAFWPVDRLVIRPFVPGISEDEKPAFSAPALLGQEFHTGYIHSVQRTPVLDTYRIVGGRIWSWRERVMSHNAGLPFQAPEYGRFRMHDPWMVIEGGRQAWPRLILRVGNAELGRNVFAWDRGADTESVALYALYPGQRLALEVERQPLSLGGLAYRVLGQ